MRGTTNKIAAFETHIRAAVEVFEQLPVNDKQLALEKFQQVLARLHTSIALSEDSAGEILHEKGAGDTQDNNSDPHSLDIPPSITADNTSAIERRLENLEQQLGLLRQENNDLKGILQPHKISTIIPLKRGRGRPRKYPRLDIIVSDNAPVAEITHSEVRSVRPEVTRSSSQDTSQRSVRGGSKSAVITEKDNHLGISSTITRDHTQVDQTPEKLNEENGTINTAATDTVTREISPKDSSKRAGDVAGDTTEDDETQNDDFPALADYSEHDNSDDEDYAEDADTKPERGHSGPRGPQKKVNRHECQVCRKAFTHGRPFNRHLLKHDPGAVCCRKCKEEFYNEAVFLSHNCLEKHRRSRQERRCRVCQQTFTSLKKLSKHLRVVHKQVSEPEYYCQYCQRGFVKKPSLYQHYKEHAGDRHVCLKCGEFLDSPDALQLHVQQHEADASYKCDKCQQTFRRRQQYESHMLGHQRYDCNICNQTFSQKKLLVTHCRTCHGVAVDETPKQYHCTQCNKAFLRPTTLETHMKSHSGEAASLRCEPCNMDFATVKGMLSHQETNTHLKATGQQTDQKNHLCPKCGRTFNRKQALSSHMRYHTDSKLYSCPHCDYHTREQNNLKRHIDLHFSARNFICETCGAAFHTKKTLETHRVYKHSNDRSYPCTECQQSFKTRSSLLRHSRSHGNKRPHKCSQCGVGFNRMYNLRRHLRSVHGNDQDLPPVNRVKLLDAPEGLEYHKGPVALGLQGKTTHGNRKKKSSCSNEVNTSGTGTTNVTQCYPSSQIVTINTDQNGHSVMVLSATNQQGNISMQSSQPTQPPQGFYGAMAQSYAPTDGISNSSQLLHLTPIQNDNNKWMFPQSYVGQEGRQESTIHHHPQQQQGDYTPAELYAAVPGLLHLMHGNTQTNMSQ